ncbi:MAG TPA: protein kinase [Kofleriaceae bacterium]|nr:protein kinase [Kofleriaceae bacterium]
MGNARDDHEDGHAALTIPERPSLRRMEPSSEPGGRLPNGATLGRYVVTGCVGTGGMGVVYSARDPDLDRNVALKVLRPELSIEASSRTRLLREARAMAQLSHPNVVPVYDVGVLDDHVFIAMELVDGVTLRRKLDRSTPWRTVIASYLQAAQGLAAAHAAGLVHRDFKPDNVLFGNDGRIRVVDFGLVSVGPISQASSSDPARLELPSISTTASGMVLGTPMFMAPEALRGEATDARADQFSFCVALFHDLYGIYPYAGATLAERMGKVSRGEIGRKHGTPVPDRVYRVLARGLRAEPDERYPSMEVVIDALEHAITPRLRARTVAASVAGVAAIGAVIAFSLARQHAPSPPLQLGPAETIARSDDQQLSVTMLRDGRYLRVERGLLTVVAADGATSRALVTPNGLVPTRARASGIPGWAEVYAAGAPCSWWQVPVDGGAWRLLLEDPTCLSEIDLSPDGKQLAIARGGELRVRDLATGSERTLLHKDFGMASDDGRIPSWSPDGKRLVVDGEISVVDVASGKYAYHGRVGAAACWLDTDHVAYVIPTWLHSVIRVVDLRTGADELALEMEGNIMDLAARSGGLLLRRDEFHSRAHIVPLSLPSPTGVDEFPQLDTGSAIDVLPAVWTQDGAVITLAMVAGQRGLVRTVPGQRGKPLVLDRARNIKLLGFTQLQIIYSINDADDCDVRIYDLGIGAVRPWRKSRCAQRPYITCARSPSRCLVVDDAGSRWFDPAAMQFLGPAPHFELDELLSPDATASVRVRGRAVLIRKLADDSETSIPVPPVDGVPDIRWGNDSSTLVAFVTAPGHQRMLIGTRDGHWRLLIDEPHRILNGDVLSPDGSQIAVVALLTTSTWSFLPFRGGLP